MTERLLSSIFARWLCVLALLPALVPAAGAQTPAPGAPVLLTEGTGRTTRAVAYEAVTFRSEPFPVVSPFDWNTDRSSAGDRQTRVMLFAMNLALLPGEGAGALSAEAQDASGRVYPLRVEALNRPKYVQPRPAPGDESRQAPAEVEQDWLWAVTLRLDEAMTDALGDVLVRVSLRGLPSNRVRVAVGRLGAGIAPDPSTEFISPAPAAAPPPAPLPQDSLPAALYVSTRGSDASDGRTPETALRTITAAAARAVPGTTVHVEGGTYFEQLVTRGGGHTGREVVFKSFNGTAVIDGSTQTWAPGGNQNQGLVELRHPYVRLSGLKVANSKNTGILLDADHLTVEGCEVAESQRHGISTHTSRQTNYPGLAGTMIRGITLKGNLVRRSSLSGSSQAVSLIADGFLVAGNTVRDNAKEGIDIWLGAKNGEVAGNTVHGNSAPGIYVDGASYVRVHSNRVFDNAKGIGVTSEDANYPTHDVWVYNNLVYDNVGAGLFVWDDRAAPGHKGSQNVLLAHNTLAGNSPSVYLSGENNSAEIMNNLGLSAGASLYDGSANSTFNTHDNVWLTSAEGFVDAANRDFRLNANSPAVNKGAPSPFFYDGLGNLFTVAADFDGLARPAGSAPDAGCFEYR